MRCSVFAHPGMRRSLTILIVTGAALTHGCESTHSRPSPGSTWSTQNAPRRDPNANRIDSTRIETRDDIVQIVAYWNQPYWLQDSERVRGFKATVYFVSGESEKGAFVPGNMFVWIYEMVPAGRGRFERKLVHGRQFSEAEALALRVNKRAAGGYYYGMILQWPRDVYLEGKQVQIQFGYERQSNKQVVLSPSRSFKVPVPINFIPPED